MPGHDQDPGEGCRPEVPERQTALLHRQSFKYYFQTNIGAHRTFIEKVRACKFQHVSNVPSVNPDTVEDEEVTEEANNLTTATGERSCANSDCRQITRTQSRRGTTKATLPPKSAKEPITMTDHPRIVLAPDLLAGKPVIRGTRLAVEFLIGLMAEGWSEADILQNYPGITHDDVLACLAYARDVLSSEKIFPSAA